MKFRNVLAAAAAVAAIAGASSAGAAVFTYDLSGNAQAGSLSWTLNNLTLTATGGVYAAAPGTLTGLSNSLVPALTAAPVDSQGGGVGVCSETTGSECNFLDTNGTTEVLKFSFSAASGYELGTGGFKMTGATFTGVNYLAARTSPSRPASGDTLLVYAADSAGADYLGYSGFIGTNFGQNPAAGNLPGGGGAIAVTFPSGGSYDQFFLTLGAVSQDLRIQSVTFEGAGPTLIPVIDPPPPPLAGVPEPATWALMIMGFGAAGSVLRRRQTAAVRA